MAQQQQHPATTSLARSHTTTGTESPKRAALPPDGADERQQARSNLIRKLSSRGAAGSSARARLPGQPTPTPVPPPASNQPGPDHPGSQPEPQPALLDQNNSNNNNNNMAATDVSQPPLRDSLTSLDSQTDPKHAIRLSPSKNTSNPRTLTHPAGHPETSWLDFSEPSSRSIASHSPDLNTEAISELTLAPTPEPTALGSPSVRSSIVSRLKARTSLSSRIDRSTATGRSPSPGHPPSRQSSIDHGSDGPADRRRSAINGNPRASRPSYSSTAQRVRPSPTENSQDRSRQSYTTLSSRVGSPSPSQHTHNGDRPLRPTRAPPITQAHNVVGGRGTISHKSSVDLGPSQFPPTPHLVRTHMPVASAVDLARYNDQKLAPFPALLSSSPPGSPERARSPPRSALKSSKSQAHGILSSASNFFRSPSRNQDENVARASSQMSSPQARSVVSPSNYPVSMSRSSEDQEEVVEPSRWQSIGDAAGKMSASVEVSRSPTLDSNSSSLASMISNQRREQILARLSPFLRPLHSSAPQDHRLNDPPRRLLWHQPVLQVVNATSVKDRYLFLFNDILVITKPVIEFEDCKGELVPKLPITLKHSFLTKSIVEIKNLRCICTNQARRASSAIQDKKNQADSEEWFQQDAFYEDPSRAIQSHLQLSGLEPTDTEIAKLLISTAALDRRQLGQFLTGPERTGILRKYLERMNLAYMRIEDGLRSVLLSLRLPADPPAIERFLHEFGVVWTMSNPKVGLSAGLVTRWTTGMIVLSEHLHDGLTDSMRYVAGFIGFPNEIRNETQFVESIVQAEKELRSQGKPSSTLSPEKLETMLKKSFQSIRRDRLVQARANVEDTEKIEMEVMEEEAGGNSQVSSKLPSHIIYQIPSELVTIRIPEPDPQFGIKLFGSGLSFEPSFLSFTESASATFRIKGKALGPRQVSMIKIGRRAAAYDGIPLDLMVSVERAFMKHTVQVGFLNHMMAKRKYLFSFLGPQPKTDFLELVEDAQAAAQHVPAGVPNGPQAVARSVALQVLIDSLIINEDLVPMNVNPYASTTVGLKTSHKSKKSIDNPPPSKKLAPSSSTGGGQRVRSNSLSETYIHTIGNSEHDLHHAILEKRSQAQDLHIRKRQHKLLQAQLSANLSGGKEALDPYSCSNKVAPVGGADEMQNLPLLRKFMFSGDSLVHHCQQNSLVPLVLGFLSMGLGDASKALAPAGPPGLADPSRDAHGQHQHEYHVI
ncbi:hypothetical protein PtB15_1B97 [Puccinia triticina]|nr:hypothetical protein PtB15_1B97 [Puccinia triticina]